MEKKKILLVTVSVGIFLVIAVGAAILLFTPQQGNPGRAVLAQRPGQGRGTPVAEAAPGPVLPAYETREIPAAPPPEREAAPAGPVPAPVSPSSASSSAPGGSAGGSNGYFVIDAEPVEGAQGDAQVVINIPRPRPVTAPDLPAPARAAPSGTAPASPNREPDRNAEARPAARNPAPQGTGRSASAPAAARPAARSVQAAGYHAWWVQAGSFSNMNRADSAKEKLASRGITSIIENNDLNGKIWYRVRIGPYTSQNEADYWLALIRTMDGFEQSQVWQSQVIN